MSFVTKMTKIKLNTNWCHDFLKNFVDNFVKGNNYVNSQVPFSDCCWCEENKFFYTEIKKTIPTRNVLTRLSHLSTLQKRPRGLKIE